MNWLKRRLKKWLVPEEILIGDEPVYDTMRVAASPNMSFTIYNAVGGKVVEFRSCNQNKEYGTSLSMYIIPSDADFGERISKIVTLESLKG